MSETLPITRAQQQANTRQRLLEVAEATFLEKGYYGSSVALVSRRAGFSTGALYSNFASKETLVLEVMDRHVAEQAQRLAVAVTTADSVREVLTKVSAWFADLLNDASRVTLLCGSGCAGAHDQLLVAGTESLLHGYVPTYHQSTSVTIRHLHPLQGLSQKDHIIRTSRCRCGR